MISKAAKIVDILIINLSILHNYYFDYPINLFLKFLKFGFSFSSNPFTSNDPQKAYFGFFFRSPAIIVIDARKKRYDCHKPEIVTTIFAH